MPTNKEAKTVLIIEDSPTQARRLELILSRSKVNTLWANEGLVGLGYAKKYKPSMILLDIELPDINGIEVCKRLKGDVTTSGIPVILLTRYGDRAAIEIGLKAGALEYIPKDAFSDAVVLETLRQSGIIEEGY
jgi:DNA-binding response OmpR family regulator